MEDLNRPIVDLSNGLHLNVVAVAVVKSLSVNVVLKVLISDVLGEVVRILKLKGGREREDEREREGEIKDNGKGSLKVQVQIDDLYPLTM